MLTVQDHTPQIPKIEYPYIVAQTVPYTRTYYFFDVEDNENPPHTVGFV